MITRIDDDLHRRLGERAEAEGRSVNALVTELLRAAVGASGERARIRARLALSGGRVVPKRPRSALPLDQVVALGRGAGRAVGEALDAERAGR